MMQKDLSALEKQKNRLLDAFNSVRQYLVDGGALPSEYNNSDGYGKLVDYVFQGTSGDDTIKQIGNQILKDKGRYDEKNDKNKFYIEE